MDSPQFNVVVDGIVLNGFDADSVLLHLQQQLKLPEAKARLLIANKTVTVKRGTTEAIARAYCSRLRAAGVAARIEPVTAAHVAAATTAAPAKRYFSEAPLAAREIARTGIFRGAVGRASAALLGTALAYGLLALSGLGLLLFYMVGYADFLVVPPILFSVSVYLIVSLALAMIATLLWRPLLAGSDDIDTYTPVSPLQEPALFAFVTQLCEKLALRAPAEIVLTTATSNSASLLPGVSNIRRGDYRLALSLPALENGSIHHYAGLLAADLATQTYLPMLRYRWLATTIDKRFDNCLNRRDWLAQRIGIFSQSAPSALASLLKLLEKIIGLANRHLQKVSSRINAIDTKLQHALLDEEDRYSALITGSASFTDLMIYRARLAAAARDAREKNLEDRIEGHLVDDLPALIRHYFDSIEENFAQNLQRRWNAETTPRKDEPPIARERIEYISGIAKPSLVTDDSAAQSLLRRRDEAARNATLSDYRRIDSEIDIGNLMPTEELTYTATQDILQRQQAAIYFNDWFRPFRFWSLADYKLISDMPLQDASMQLSVCVNKIRRLTPDRTKLLAEYERLHNQLREILIAQHVLAAGKKFTFRYIHYDGTTLAPVLEDRQQEIAAVMEKLLQQETVMGGRITLGLRLSGQDQREVSELHDALRMLHDIGARLYKISLDCFQLEQLLHRQHQLREADYSLPIKKLETKIDDACKLLLVRLNDIPYPLDSRHRSLKSFAEKMLEKSQRKSASPVLQRVLRLIDVLYHVNEKFSRQAADYGTIAEEAYRIEPIRLIK